MTQTYVIEGIIIFPVTESIPQDVIIIPCSPSAISHNVRGHWLYFQCIRWTQPSLKYDIANCKRVPIRVEGIINPTVSFFDPKDTNFEMTYGRITLRKDRPREVNRDPRDYLIRITINDAMYDIRYRDEPRSFGIPKAFESLDW